MTPKQKYIFEVLFNGGDIVYNGRGIYTLRRECKITVMRFDTRTYMCIRHYLRRGYFSNNFSVWTANKSAILKLSWKSWLKRAYVIQRNTKKKLNNV